MASRNSLVIVLFLLLAAACGRPSGNHCFVSTETARENGGVFAFTLSTEDSAAVYATFVAARVVRSRIPEETLEFDIQITPPNGQPTIERQSFPLTERPGVKINLGTGSVTDYEWPWHAVRTSGHPAGIWNIRITPADPARLEAIYGVGFSYEARPWEKAN